MRFITFAETNDRTIAARIGCSEYSYYFVERAFRPVLAQLGTVVEVTDPERDVDAVWQQAQQEGDDCVFLCYDPPHKVPTSLRCPTVPVFAWEFDTLPDEVWRDERRNDWTAVLRQLGRAIVHSGHTCDVLRQRLGTGFPAVSVPAPVWSRARSAGGDRHRGVRDLVLHAPLIDSRDIDLSGFDRAAPIEERRDRASALFARRGEQRIVLDGVVYTSVFNPFDGRKRAWDLISHFVWAMRERPDATLLLKTSHPDMLLVMVAMLAELVKLHPFRCRIVIVHGYVAADTYLAMLRGTDFIVNCSAGEGQCLPLMEFMSAGRPAIAPRHTAMADYVDESNAFIVDGHPEPTIWPHDQREMFRATRMRTDFMSLVRAFQDSFVVARTDPGRYRAMSEAASASLARQCGDDVVRDKLRTFFGNAAPAAPACRVREQAGFS